TAAAGFHGPVGPSPCRRPCESSFPDSVGIWQELSCVLPIPSWLGRKSSDRGHLLRLCRVTARLFSAPSNVGRVPPHSAEARLGRGCRLISSCLMVIRVRRAACALFYPQQITLPGTRPHYRAGDAWLTAACSP